VRPRNKEEGGRKKRIFPSRLNFPVVPSSLLILPLLFACKPKPADAPSASEKLKSLEAKTERVVEAAKDKIESLEERFSRERAEFSARFEAQLKRTEARLGELKRRAELDASRRPEIERGIRVLEERTKALRERIDRVKSATSEQWDQIKEPWQKKEGYEDYEDQIIKETST
jgi:chromosome segregation ATPase